MEGNSEFTLVHVQNISPALNSHTTLYRLEYFGATVKFFSQYPPQSLKVQLWTNVLNKLNSEGNWHPIELDYQYIESNDLFVFQGCLMPTSEGEYQFTYRFGLSHNEENWQWAGNFGENGYLRVEPPSDSMMWTQGPSCVEFLPGVYVGNFIAASQAEKLGIDAILNMASELTLTIPPESKIIYRQLGTLDGAQHPISDDLLLKAVQWIDEQVSQAKKKVLIHCRAGIGRSGSVSVAYCFYKNPLWSYEQTLQYIWSQKPDIYPHKHLQESLERLFPRQTN